MKNNVIGPNPGDYRPMDFMDYVYVECKCPKCKRIFVKRVRSGEYIDKNFIKSQVCDSCKWKKTKESALGVLRKLKKK